MTQLAAAEGAVSRHYMFDHAWLADGWRRDVRVTVADGVITALSADAPRQGAEGAERVAGLAVPGLPNLHCHAFQRGLAGLAERRGPAAVAPPRPPRRAARPRR